MRKQESEIVLLSKRADSLSLEREKLIRKLEKSRKEIEKITKDPEKIRQSQSKLMAEVDAIEEEIKQVAKTQKTIEQKLEKIEKSPSKLDLKTAITIRRDKALAPLTECQIKILKILATEGEKTAPEMRPKIGISREHTSRLMSRLYDEGYVERNMRKTPYVYRIKEEARKFFKK